MARLVLVVVGTLTLCGLGLYGVWYWVRMLTRVPPFLDVWRAGLTSEIETKPEREEWFLPTRPPGYFFPPTLLWWTLPAMHVGTWESPRLPPAWAVLAWLTAFALTVWTAYRGLESAPQPAHTDQRALPVSFFLVTVGWWIETDLTTEGQYDLGSSYIVGLITGRVSVGQFLAVFAEPGATLALAVVTIPLYCFWFEDISDWRSRDDWWGYAYVPYLLVPVAACGVLAALIVGLWERVSIGVLATVIFGLLCLGVLDDFGIVDIKW